MLTSSTVFISASGFRVQVKPVSYILSRNLGKACTHFFFVLIDTPTFKFVILQDRAWNADCCNLSTLHRLCLYAHACLCLFWKRHVIILTTSHKLWKNNLQNRVAKLFFSWIHLLPVESCMGRVYLNVKRWFMKTSGWIPWLSLHYAGDCSAKTLMARASVQESACSMGQR